MTYTESKNKLDEIRNRNEVMFRMALSHLIDVGVRHLTDALVEKACEDINKQDDRKHIMKNEFLCEIVKTAGELAKIDHICLMMYIQKEMTFGSEDGKER